MKYKKEKFTDTGIPLVAVVIDSSTDAEINAGAVITYEEKK